jgi:limonene 1,2-monooxygenase
MTNGHNAHAPVETVESLSSSMQFGTFMAPIHPPTHSISSDIGHDLALVEYMDELGFDEACFGEHHTGGHEIYTSPEVMIAAAAARTKRIRLGTGVASLAYRHPLIIADTMAFLDHLTKGRVFFGVGPGALPGDARMMGIDYTDNRRRMEESMDAIMHLFTSDEPLTVDKGWFKIEEGFLNYKSYQRPHPPMAVASVASPGGPRVAGKFGLPLLSLTGQNGANVKIIADHWQIMETRSIEFGVAPAPRADWRLVGPMHIAESRADAERDVQYGLADWMKYFFRLPVEFLKLRDELGNEVHDATDVEVIRGTGFGVIGTPDDAIAHIERLQASTGGFGKFMFLQHAWANPGATMRSMDLFAQYVMPHFQDGLSRRQARWDYDAVRLKETVGDITSGMKEAQDRHNAEYAAKGIYTPSDTANILS